MGYFGIPFRNGVPIGLGSIVGFGAPQEFSPSELFLGGTAGAWYDPSDLSTLFTTSAGTTQCAMPGGGAAVSVGRMLDKSGNGNHAIAFNDTTARPELRARVNLLTYSEEFDNGAWTKQNSTVTPNATTAPDGTTTADAIIASAGTGIFRGVFISEGTPAPKVLSFFVKKADKRWVYLLGYSGAGGGMCWFDLDNAVVGTRGANYSSSSIQAVGNGWYRIAASMQAAIGGTTNVGLYASDADNSITCTGDGSAVSVYAWGADLRPANIGANVPAYQRIADANTYDTSGFPLYLFFDGIDDSMYTPANLNLSGTDKVSVFAGVRKLSDGVLMLTEFGPVVDTTNGSFALLVPGAARWSSRLRGTAYCYYDSETYTAPITNVIATSYNIAGAARADEIQPRINGVLNQTNGVGADAGTGNFSSLSLFIGSRNNASVRFNGHLHSLIIAGSAVSAGNISATESWVAGRTGIQI